MTDVIETRDVEKDFVRGDHRVRALKGVSVSIGRGEFVAIVGKSGSGKSTFMNILGCLDRPSQGSYLLDGQDVAELSADQRAEVRGQKIGFVFQAFNLIPRTSALENVELPLIYSEVSRADQARRARESLVTLGLGDRADHHPSELSGGEQQRVAIARALANDPSILFADEPTGNLDSATALQMFGLLADLHDQRHERGAARGGQGHGGPAREKHRVEVGDGGRGGEVARNGGHVADLVAGGLRCQ
jgi:putative ABC transport system ATP-binding protein